jgi:hypothetical protein
MTASVVAETADRKGIAMSTDKTGAAAKVDDPWLAETLARFTPNDLRRVGEVLAVVADGIDTARRGCDAVE